MGKSYIYIHHPGVNVPFTEVSLTSSILLYVWVNTDRTIRSRTMWVGIPVDSIMTKTICFPTTIRQVNK